MPVSSGLRGGHSDADAEYPGSIDTEFEVTHSSSAEKPLGKFSRRIDPIIPTTQAITDLGQPRILEGSCFL
jgi:hypothetical protein